MSSIVLAGTNSGVGKTTISIGLMKALINKGLNVQSFKVGPDYIDPSFHKFVTNNPSYNLDTWMLEKDTIKYIYNKNIKNKDIGIVEGVMGLYDGFGSDKDSASTSSLSRDLSLPVILIIDGSGISTSAAALVLGYKNYCKDTDIKGIIINKVSSKYHYDLLKDVIERDTKIECLGYFIKNKDISLESRHLGLIPANEVMDLEEKIDKLSKEIEKTINLDKIIEIASSSKPKVENLDIIKKEKDLKSKYQDENIVIGIFKDSAFSFYYESNIELLKEIGAKIKYISPLNDKKIDDDINFLYMGGGFPELFAKDLENNKDFRLDLKSKLESGLRAYGECGALMYLTEKIKGLDEKENNMVGFFPTTSFMTKKLQRFGYINVNISGIKIKAHEFHRSLVEENDNINYLYEIEKNRVNKKTNWKCGLFKNNTIAGYPHIDFYSNLDFLDYLLQGVNN